MDIRNTGRKIKSFSHLFILLLFVTMCSGCLSIHNEKSASISNNVSMPEWILNPSKNGVIGGVGYCAAHVDGISGQRELASKRALEEIARQKSVSVDSVMVVSSSASNQTKYNDTKVNSVSTFKSNNNVQAYIKEIWIHPVTKVMYVYMIAE